MKLSGIITMQEQWEVERGLDEYNRQLNLGRIQEELDEAKAEADPRKRLEEIVDVVIICSGELARLAKECGLKPEDVEKMFDDKLDINEQKYKVEYFQHWDTEQAIAYARFIWSFNPPHWEEGNDIR